MIKQHSLWQKALKTNKITKQEAELFFEELKKETDQHIRKNYQWYVKKGYWPIKACVKNGAQKDPVFVVNHHTSSKNRTHGGAMARFFTSSMASANFLITDDGTILYLVDLKDMSYHAIKRSFIPLAIARALKIDENRWVNECGVEICGNGMNKLFTPQAFEATIVLQRMVCAYFQYSIKELKSHRFFSYERKGDPGVFYFLPLVFHAVFNDVDIWSEDYWLDNYASDQVRFANGVSVWMEQLGVAHLDEWSKERKKIKANGQMLL